MHKSYSKHKSLSQSYKDTEKHKSKSAHNLKADTNKEPTNNALVIKQSSFNLQAGKPSLNNNNSKKQKEKEKEMSIDILSVGFGKADAFNGAGLNNNRISDDFANFDAFLSTKFDPFANSDFSDGIGFNSTQIYANKASADTTDGILSNLSLSPSLRSTLTNETSKNIKNQNINEYFDTKFNSFVTNDPTNKMADESNANSNINSQQILQQQFNSGGAEGFADFNKANAFKENNPSSKFEAAFPSSGALDANLNTSSKSKSAADCDTTTNDTEKVPSKFINDYSKSDDFDADLQEALKRSLVYQ